MNYIVETPRCGFRFLSEEDAPRVRELLSDPGLMQFLGGPNPKSSDQHRLDIRKYPSSLRMIGVQLKHQPGLVGLCGLISPLLSKQEAEIWIVLDASFHSIGIGKETFQALLDVAKSIGNFQRLTAKIHPTNTASCRLVRHFGFNQVGEDTNHDSRQFGFSIYEFSAGKQSSRPGGG